MDIAWGRIADKYRDVSGFFTAGRSCDTEGRAVKTERLVDGIEEGQSAGFRFTYREEEYERWIMALTGRMWNAGI